VAVVLFLLWLSIEKAGTAASSTSASGVTWEPFSFSLAFYGYIFTGMRWVDGVDKVSVVLWIAIGALGVYAFFAGGQEKGRFLHPSFVFFILTTMAVFVFPFRIGHYTFISLRIAAVSYLFLAMLAGHLKFKRAWKGVFTILVAAVLIQSVIKQERISGEIEEIAPLVARIPPNSVILPLVFDNNTPELERAFFDMHLHDHNYYHLLVGGGVSPYFPKQPLVPVHYKPGVTRPAPGEYTPHHFRWERHASDYRYFLVRGAPDLFVSYLADKTELIGLSGDGFFLRDLEPAENDRDYGWI
jgi:hypothetical protein